MGMHLSISSSVISGHQIGPHHHADPRIIPQHVLAAWRLSSLRALADGHSKHRIHLRIRDNKKKDNKKSGLKGLNSEILRNSAGICLGPCLIIQYVGAEAAKEAPEETSEPFQRVTKASTTNLEHRWLSVSRNVNGPKPKNSDGSRNE